MAISLLFVFVQEGLRSIEGDGVQLAIVEFKDAEAREGVVLTMRTEGDIVNVDVFSCF